MSKYAEEQLHILARGLVGWRGLDKGKLLPIGESRTYSKLQGEEILALGGWYDAHVLGKVESCRVISKPVSEHRCEIFLVPSTKRPDAEHIPWHDPSVGKPYWADGFWALKPLGSWILLWVRFEAEGVELTDEAGTTSVFSLASWENMETQFIAADSWHGANSKFRHLFQVGKGCGCSP